MKVTVHENFRVEVHPKLYSYHRDIFEKGKDERRTCEEIQSAINRHVDDLHSVLIVHDTTEICQSMN